MINHNPLPRAVSLALLGAVVVGALPALAQEPAPQDDTTDIGTVVVTGSRIQRQDYIANSPTMTVQAEQILGNSDVTLDTYLNTLPQVNPAGTSTSNNPPNGGQSNIDLRGLGANRNLVLIDGRRAMVSASNMTVDLNTIPQALIESVEIVTGGAGAVYGADAVAGATNVKLKRNFSGFDLRTNYSNSTEEWDAEEYQVSAVLGANFAEDAGNVAIAFDYSDREGMIKSQRPFAAVATATTTFLPEGLYFPSGNSPSQAAVDSVFGAYGVAAGAVPAGASLIGFNLDNTLFSRGTFNTPFDVQNWRYPVDIAVNSRLFPDVYSYNFDSVNILTLPLERRSFLSKFDYEFGESVEVFAQLGWTEYDSTIAIAPTPTPTVSITAPGFNTDTQATSPLITAAINPMTGLPFAAANLLVVPTTNPFIPADFATLLASRTGDNLNLVGSGATEPFLMRQRTLSAGARTQDFENTVVQYLLGARGPLFGENWRWEAYASEGRTEIDQMQGGNIDTQRLQQLLEAPDGGASACAGGFDPFGRNPLSPECVNFLEVSANLTNEFVQTIFQAFVAGDVFDMPAGPLSIVVGAEYRDFEYTFDPGTAGGPISGFNAQDPAAGTNTFKDGFFEALVPIVTNLELNLGYRYSKSEFEDTINNVSSNPSSDNSYKGELSWQALDSLRLRTSYQRAVRAPNFTELFDGSGSAPQYFDPCSITSAIRNGADGAAVRQLCIDTGLGAAAADIYVQTPGTQLTINQAGNTSLVPETADTITFGLVFNSPFDGALERLRGSIDYYTIDVSDPILIPDPNMLLSSCFNYFGGNPTYDANNINCQAIVRPAGSDILLMADPGDPDGLYPGVNGGKIKTDGIDLQLDYGFDIGNAGTVTMNLLVSYLLSFELQERSDLPTIDYAGSVSYFGEGLGTSFPEWKANLNLAWTRGPFSFAARSRWIDSMENRASLQFPGETSFTSPESVMYWDFVAGWEFMENSELRFGVNNAFDEQPPTYAPNVQSGTDPSLYDVVGRRAFGQVNFRF